MADYAQRKSPRGSFILGLFCLISVGLSCRKQLINLSTGDLVRVDSVVESSFTSFALQVYRAFTLDLKSTEFVLTEVSSTRSTRRNIGQTGARKPLTVCGQQAQPDLLCVVSELVALDCLNCVLDCVSHFLALHLT